MADTPENSEETEEQPKKKGMMIPMILGLVLALAGGGGGFFAVQSGLLFGNSDSAAEAAIPLDPLPDIAFLPIDPLTVSLNDNGATRHLRFRAQLEVEGPAEVEVTQLMPRVVDVLNSYLRAVDMALLNDPAALVAIRAQMLRRIQVVVGNGRVRDLLIMEFVLS